MKEGKRGRGREEFLYCWELVTLVGENDGVVTHRGGMESWGLRLLSRRARWAREKATVRVIGPGKASHEKEKANCSQLRAPMAQG